MRKQPAIFHAKELRQAELQNVIKLLFPNEKILINVRKESSLRNPSTGYYLELDVWLPNLKLAFEFQDAYHYTSTYYSHKPIRDIKHKDNLKKKLVESAGQTLITVPFWWDGSKESLAGSIRERRPELLKNDDVVKWPPISQIPPDNIKVHKIPNVGELMLASFPAYDSFYTSISPSTPWWLGEKYDGVRGCWVSSSSKLYTRSGLEIVVPQIFINQFARITVDGEIWFGRNLFYEAQEFIQSSAYPQNLEYFRFVAFDQPVPSSPIEYELRIKKLLINIPHDHSFMMIPSRMRCSNKVQLTKILKEAITHGGEGVILQLPKSHYEHGRSSNVLKLKAARGDKEALVIGIKQDLTATLQLPNGVAMEVNPHDIKPELHVGDVVTFSYQNISKFLVPTGITVERIRKDISWESIVHDFQEPVPNTLTRHSADVVDYAPRTYGYWVHSKRKQMRKFLEKVLSKFGRDPSVPENWYSLSSKFLKQIKGIKPLLKKFDGSLSSALLYLFPDIGLKASRLIRSSFAYKKRGYWADIKNQKQFFDEFALQNKFDPLLPSNWYHVNKHSFLSSERASSILRYYKGDFGKALRAIYSQNG